MLAMLHGLALTTAGLAVKGVSGADSVIESRC